jgi:carboxypeptidase Taq
MRHGFAPDAQQAFGEQIIDAFGYDFERGRQDRSAHPFTTSFSIDDVRLTTRFDEHFLPSGLFSTLHEAGHGLYEQGIDPALERTPLAEGTSLGMHESQSRLWENLVGRSRPFWSHYYPALQDAFPDAFEDVSLDAFYRAINKVEPSLIRVESDEVTYNLHIMLRFELERGLVQGTVSVDALPDLWRAKMDEYLGVQPDTDAEGVLQDVHWSMGAIGYFPTYALGNLMSVQLFDQIRQDLPDLDTQIARGDFDALLGWLREHIHQYGRMHQAPDLLERVTGDELHAAPWLRYIRDKYSALYNVALP